MCGIAALVDFDEAARASVLSHVAHQLSSRGPDGIESVELGDHVTLHASVLHMRGVLTRQPLQSAAGNVLCFNGEVYGGIDARQSSSAPDSHIETCQVPEGRNDTQCLMEAIEMQGLCAVLDVIQGPFALCYWDAAQRALFFARDVIGRRSLVWQALPGGLYVGSVALIDTTDAIEMQAGSLYECRSDSSRRMNVAQCLVSRPLCFRSCVFKASQPALPKLVDPRNTFENPSDDCVQESVDGLLNVLEEAIKLRILTLSTTLTGEARVAILFSGGLDSTVIALIANKFVHSGEPIDLINVAFESPRVLKALPDGTSPYDTPDRLTCRASLAELKRVRPQGHWRLLQVDVPFEEAEAAKATVKSLIYPQMSEMDMASAQSIGLALFFAASAPTAARALFSGLGADEMLGGYSRHRRCFSARGFPGLAEEMQVDMDRIGVRNLGRDDRCIASQGKEARYPFLDEHVVRALSSTDLRIRCDPMLGEGVGDKRLLRCLAKQLGLQSVARFPKRAIQFGSRSAKRSLNVGIGRSKGTDAVT